MPPRYAYWTILVDEQPTAFRAGDRDDLQPTFKRLKAKHASARVVWFQNLMIWDSRLDAQKAIGAGGEMGRRREARQGGGFRDARSERPTGRGTGGREPMGDRHRGDRPAPPVERRDPAGKLEWKPKGEATDRPKPEWRPKSTGKPSSPRYPRATAKPTERRDRGKLDWQPKGTGTPSSPQALRPSSPRRPRATAKPGDRRDKTWRPGGEHRDPRQKYKDAKKAKWTRFKQTIRKRWESKQGKKKDGE